MIQDPVSDQGMQIAGRHMIVQWDNAYSADLGTTYHAFFFRGNLYENVQDSKDRIVLCSQEIPQSDIKKLFRSLSKRILQVIESKVAAMYSKHRFLALYREIHL